MTQAAGAAAISDEAYFADVTAKVIAERTRTTDELRRRGFTVFDSATNFCSRLRTVCPVWKFLKSCAPAAF